MKSTRYLISFVFLSIFLSACSGLLNKQPVDQISTGTYYKTKNDAIAAVNGVYAYLTFDSFNFFNRGFYLLTDLPTDDAAPGQGVDNSYILALQNYTYGPTNDRLATFWQDSYTMLNADNMAIAKIPGVKMDKTLKNRLLGESRFLRALMYFYLVRMWGGVPLVTKPTTSLSDLNASNATTTQIYDQIIKDLNFAIANLPATYPSSDYGRATSGAAKGLLAKVYLFQKKPDQTEKLCQDIINSGDYSLVKNYADVFRPSTEDNSEVMFAAQFKSNSGGLGMAVRLDIPRSTIPGIVGWGADFPTKEFYDSFRSGDTRKSWTFFTSYTVNGKTYQFPPSWHKYWDVSSLSNTLDFGTNYPILRYSDILLMYAEAENDVNGPTTAAYNAINKVRRRAFGEDINSASAQPHDLTPGLSKSAFQDSVWAERRWEFGDEGQRRFNLIREGRLISVMAKNGITVKPYQELYPIPQREIDLNPNLKQNNGYK